MFWKFSGTFFMVFAPPPHLPRCQLPVSDPEVRSAEAELPEHERSQKNVPKHKGKLLTTIQDRYKSILKKHNFLMFWNFLGLFSWFWARPPPTSDSWPCLFWLVRLGCVFFFHLDPEFRPLESLNDDISELRRSRIKNWVSRHNYFLRTLT